MKDRLTAVTRQLHAELLMRAQLGAEAGAAAALQPSESVRLLAKQLLTLKTVLAPILLPDEVRRGEGSRGSSPQLTPPGTYPPLLWASRLLSSKSEMHLRPSCPFSFLPSPTCRNPRRSPRLELPAVRSTWWETASSWSLHLTCRQMHFHRQSISFSYWFPRPGKPFGLH